MLPLGSEIVGIKLEHVPTERAVNATCVITVVVPCMVPMIMAIVTPMVMIMVVLIVIVTFGRGLCGISIGTPGQQATAEQSEHECGKEL